MKKCIIYGNCQSKAIANILRANREFNSQYEINNFVVHLASPEEAKQLARLVTKADLFIYQLVADNYNNCQELGTRYLANRLKETAQTITFPSLYFAGYSPEVFSLKNKQGVKVGEEICPYHDLNLLNLFYQGKSVNQAAQIIQQPDFYSAEFVVNNFKETLGELARRETRVDVKAVPFISKFYQKRKLFHTTNHPCSSVIYYVVNQILTTLGLANYRDEDFCFGQEEILDTHCLPFYPSVIRHLNLKFANLDRYRMKGVWYKIDKGIERYFRYYENNLDIVQFNLEAQAVKLGDQVNSVPNQEERRSKTSNNINLISSSKKEELKQPDELKNIAQKLLAFIPNLQQGDCWQEGIELCELALKLDLNNIEAWHRLLQCRYQMLLKAENINPESPLALTQNYIQQARDAQRQNKWQQARKLYKKVIYLNPYVADKIYFNLQHCQQKLDLQQEEITTYQQWIGKHYLIGHRHKLIYCPIALNSTDIFKTILIKASDKLEKYNSSQLKVNQFINRHKINFALKDISYLENIQYLKIIVLREPLSRLLAAYLDKFVHRRDKSDPHALPVIEDVYQHLGLKLDIKRSITFSQFVDYLTRTENSNLESHWLPQSIYFAAELVKFDYIAQHENLTPALDYLQTKLDLEIEPNLVATSQKKAALIKNKLSSNQENLADLYPHQLAQIKQINHVDRFYNPDIAAKVKAKYVEDIELYEQHFGS